MQKRLKERGPFGEFLFLQLKNRYCKSAQWLADEVTNLGEPLDASLVRRWMAGSRVPKESHTAISKIAIVLECPEGQMQDIHSKARKWFREKQASSHKKTRAQNNSGLLEQDKKTQSPLTKDHLRFENRCNLKPGEKSIGIEGERETIEAVICFLAELPPPAHKGAELYLMMNGRTATIEEFANELLPHWYEAMKSALEKGWAVFHVIRLDDDLKRIQKLVRGILLLTGQKGRYTPLAFKQKYVMPVAESFLLVPSLHKGMIFYSCKDPGFVGSTIYIEDEAQIRILTQHFKLLKAETNPIFQTWNNYADVVSYLKLADLAPGKRIVVLKRLSNIHRPKHWYSEETSWAKAHQVERDLDIDELRQSLNDRIFRRQSLETNALTHSTRYIYTNKCIDLYFQEGKEVYLPNYRATEQERLEQLFTFKELLHHPHYEMALTEEDMYENLSISNNIIQKVEFPDIIPDFCEVQENHLVLLHFSIEQGEMRRPKSKWIVIEEPVIVKAFYQYISDIWLKTIPAPRKDKFQIHRWLEEHEKALAQ